mmetsp:Transcript_39884/g.85097  ORF Transcript_39884/g.85097 Transcript_39884/m.85097 type:complete len:318 (-) Transcript_39884:583-1536(-)
MGFCGNCGEVLLGKSSKCYVCSTKHDGVTLPPSKRAKGQSSFQTAIRQQDAPAAKPSAGDNGGGSDNGNDGIRGPGVGGDCGTGSVHLRRHEQAYQSTKGAHLVCMECKLSHEGACPFARIAPLHTENELLHGAVKELQVRVQVLEELCQRLLARDALLDGQACTTMRPMDAFPLTDAFSLADTFSPSVPAFSPWIARPVDAISPPAAAILEPACTISQRPLAVSTPATPPPSSNEITQSDPIKHTQAHNTSEQLIDPLRGAWMGRVLPSPVATASADVAMLARDQMARDAEGLFSTGKNPAWVLSPGGASWRQISS